MKADAYLKKLYTNRFDSSQMQAKVVLWKVLIDDFLQKYVPSQSSVLDIGGGYCEFINQIRAEKKYLIDLNPDSKLFANPDVEVLNIDVLNLGDFLFAEQFDRIFISNFFEHLTNKEELIQIISFCFDVLKPNGSLLIIQPNFKYSYREYYDFIDHQLPITHLSLQELLQTVGFKIDLMIPRFLPFSTKGRPASPLLLKLYLKLPFLWQFLGGQMFVKASKRSNS
ncbi:bifunctional 2-polyprenyl-6-hydroxyphenol methylase/3-demethylubiquinol 3-O-methyltransferase UbiG [Tychonema sp. BBK16]|uniref:class I SAM-dependent methyltransferase n=1 Tax=Tychonema sp. BBK16 TaxID=2699888 RepID=UPI001F1F2562|nr:methyltransferase domain-containing protein [Tychonema sp. BBK16]MCF6374863.1 class I SAM-dependent methyltransferase [Tychonema sp. BBK16]